MRKWSTKDHLMHESGFYRIYSETYCYSVWFVHPKNYRRIGESETLRGAKEIAERNNPAELGGPSRPAGMSR